VFFSSVQQELAGPSRGSCHCHVFGTYVCPGVPDLTGFRTRDRLILAIPAGAARNADLQLVPATPSSAPFPGLSC